MIHPTAIVDDGAELETDVSVGPYACIGKDVHVGRGTEIGPYAVIHPHTTLGEECRVHAHAVLGDVPQDRDFDGCESAVSIGKGCIIREGVTIHRGTKEGTVTEIGDECFLMGFSHFAHNVRLGKAVTVANGVLLGGYAQVGDGAFLSGNCAVHQFVRVGRLAMLGGLSAVSKDVPPFCTVRTGAFNRIAGLNVVGMRRAGMGPGERGEVKAAFRLLYRSGLAVSEACRRIQETFSEGPALEFCSFVESSKRGLMGTGPAKEGTE